MKEWYEKWFSDKLYLEIYKHRDEGEAKQLIDLIQRSLPLTTGNRVLDICCGAGRHSVEMALRGFKVTGFDLSGFLIKEAQNHLRQTLVQGLDVKFLKKDMRNFNFRSSFDLAINIFTSFGYFDNDKENFKVFRNAANSLKKGGFFVFDYLNSIYLKSNLVPSGRSKSGKITILQKRRIENGFVIKDITIKDGIKEKKFSEVLKLYEPFTLLNVMPSFGFKVIKAAGDYTGSPFNHEKSNRLIIFAVKK